MFKPTARGDNDKQSMIEPARKGGECAADGPGRAAAAATDAADTDMEEKGELRRLAEAGGGNGADRRRRQAAALQALKRAAARHAPTDRSAGMPEEPGTRRAVPDRRATLQRSADKIRRLHPPAEVAADMMPGKSKPPFDRCPNDQTATPVFRARVALMNEAPQGSAACEGRQRQRSGALRRAGGARTCMAAAGARSTINQA